VQKEYNIGATAISEELEGIGRLSSKEGHRKDNSIIVQTLIHYSTIFYA
jgi:hypothetical protein